MLSEEEVIPVNRKFWFSCACISKWQIKEAVFYIITFILLLLGSIWILIVHSACISLGPYHLTSGTDSTAIINSKAQNYYCSLDNIFFISFLWYTGETLKKLWMQIILLTSQILPSLKTGNLTAIYLSMTIP